MSTLHDPIRIGALELKNRIVMAPLTRSRSGISRVPNQLMVDYYTQRCSAGLIITEATSVTPQGVGYPNTPGIWSRTQIEGWRKVTDAVHAAGGLIALQLWHVGRISDPIFLHGELPVAPSAIAAEGNVSLVVPQRPFTTPRELPFDEIPHVVDAFRMGAKNAKAAGFDGVEIHGGNGYLLDQFLQDSTNKRTDSYGGSLENRARLMLEVTDACVDVWGADRVGMHLSPGCDIHSMGDSDPEKTFTYIASELGKRDIAFICSREGQSPDMIGPRLKRAFGGSYIANQQLDATSAQALLDRGDADAIAFGVLFIANPDLPARFKLKASLNIPDPETFYTPTAKGYTDYPALKKTQIE